MLATLPNIILINCDDLGYGDLGCYGSACHRTPAIDRLATQGLKLTSFYMASSVCSPSRGALMTGCYPKRISFDQFEGKSVLFPGQGVGLHPEEKTIANVLKGAGYATMLIGKWHCGDQAEFLPTRHGFDRYYGLPYSNDMGMQAGSKVERPPLPLMMDEEVLEEQPSQSSLTERYVEQSVRFIREHRQMPFFLYLAHMHVHLPLYAPERFHQQSRNGDYGAAVECVDWSVAVLYEELKKQGLEEQTLIIFTSDNGARGDRGGSNRPLRGNKGTTWEGGMRVPCILHWPGTIPAGTVSDELIASIDLFPTLAHLACAQVPADRVIDGVDQRKLLLEPESAVSARDVFYYYHRDTMEAVRLGNWKLHLYKEGRAVRELYELKTDNGETTNRYDEHPELVEEIMRHVMAGSDELGNASMGLRGRNVRPIGQVNHPVTLTQYNPEHPYMYMMYDKGDRG